VAVGWSIAATFVIFEVVALAGTSFISSFPDRFTLTEGVTSHLMRER
jgi:hypothetical protein